MDEKPTKKSRAAGIFGVKSNVKIFSFNSRAELWEDESGTDDEDFRPTKFKPLEMKAEAKDITSNIEKEKNGNEKRKYNKNKEHSPSKRQKKSECYQHETLELKAEAATDEVQSEVVTTPARHQLLTFLNENPIPNVDHFLPPELLTKIFKVITDEEPKQAVEKLIKLSQVCDQWRQIILQAPELWETIDVSNIHYAGIENDFLTLCNNTNALRSVKHLTLTGWNIISEEHINTFVDTFGAKLRSLNLRDCYNITQSCLQTFANKCPSLEILDLSRTSYTHVNPSPQHCKRDKNKEKSITSNPLTPTSFKSFLSICGKNLKGLNLAENKLQSVTVIVNAIMENCPNLTHLDLSNIESSSTYVLNIDKLQDRCPYIKVLRCANLKLQASHRAAGFAHLEELVIPVQGEASFGHSDTIIGALTEKAEKLNMLNISGSRSLSVSSLMNIPSWSIKYLSLAYCNKLHIGDLQMAINKWKESLIDFDLSWNVNEESVKNCLDALSDADNSQLRTLQLRGSAVSFSSVKRLFMCCNQMVSIDMQSCRGLPRGIKRLFEGEEFRKFFEDVKSGKYHCE